MKKPTLIFLIISLVAGCYYDNEESLYPQLDKTCDTTGVAFAKTILPILQSNCYTCHGAGNFAGNGGSVNLEDFASLKQTVANGRLYGSVIHDGIRSPMPKNGFKLDTCSITKIKIWIDKGALPN